MVEKKEGAEMNCYKCGTHVICRTRRYKASGNYPEKTVLQWQNEDGTAHYSTTNGKDFTCNIPEGTEPQPSEYIPAQKPSTKDYVSLEFLDEKLNRVHGMCEAILHIVTDMKTKEVSSN